jgi:hypothetical protein
MINDIVFHRSKLQFELLIAKDFASTRLMPFCPGFRSTSSRGALLPSVKFGGTANAAVLK